MWVWPTALLWPAERQWKRQTKDIQRASAACFALALGISYEKNMPRWLLHLSSWSKPHRAWPRSAEPWQPHRPVNVDTSTSVNCWAGLATPEKRLRLKLLLCWTQGKQCSCLYSKPGFIHSGIYECTYLFCKYVFITLDIKHCTRETHVSPCVWVVPWSSGEKGGYAGAHP